jgi:hypothetical protein
VATGAVAGAVVGCGRGNVISGQSTNLTKIVNPTIPSRITPKNPATNFFPLIRRIASLQIAKENLATDGAQMKK